MLLGLLMSVSAIAVTGSIDPATVSSRDLIPAFLPLVLPIGILFLPLLDLGFAVLRRLRRGKSPFAPDRGHIHHQLQDIGHGHRGTVLVFYHWTLLISLSSLAFFFLAQQVVIALVSVWFFLALLHTFWPVIRNSSANSTKREVTQND
jgi:UDP-GlcNAc:undecaprenyl-phosphate GlcNAc-1-phosphate transferase